jgi:hypothetical protein
MQVKATATVIYDREFMDRHSLTDAQFIELVKRLVPEDFNGGIEFKDNDIDIEKLQ